MLPTVGAGAPPPKRLLPFSAPDVAVPPAKGMLLLAAALGVDKPLNKFPLLPEVVVDGTPPRLPKLGVTVVFLLNGDGLEGFAFGCAPPKTPPVEAGPDEGIEEKPDPPPNVPLGFDCWLPNSPPAGAPKVKPVEDEEVLEPVLGWVPVDAPNSGVDGLEGGFDMVDGASKRIPSKELYYIWSAQHSTSRRQS